MSLSPPSYTAKPVVLIPACHRQLGDQTFHLVREKYIDAVRLAGCQPLIVPNAKPDELEALFQLADGLLLTGSPSNVHPSHFDQPVHDASLPLDTDRDAWTLPFIRLSLKRSMPLFGICRGLQEVNVALGGSLYQAVHEVANRRDHRGITSGAAEVQYALAHDVHLQPGGMLSKLLEAQVIQVNSVHIQGVDRLGAGLRAEALAPDGLIEAFSMPQATGFNLCVQWHPEWQAASNPVSMRLFKAFGAACAAFRAQRLEPSFSDSILSSAGLTG
jgi:putative glutamine amidotransferase